MKVSSKRKGILGKGAEMRAWKRRRKRERIERSIDVHRANISIYVPRCRHPFVAEPVTFLLRVAFWPETIGDYKMYVHYFRWLLSFVSLFFSWSCDMVANLGMRLIASQWRSLVRRVRPCPPLSIDSLSSPSVLFETEYWGLYLLTGWDWGSGFVIDISCSG